MPSVSVLIIYPFPLKCLIARYIFGTRWCAPVTQDCPHWGHLCHICSLSWLWMQAAGFGRLPRPSFLDSFLLDVMIFCSNCRLSNTKPPFNQITVNPLRARFFRGNIKHICTFHVIPLHWYDTGRWNPSWNKTRTYPFYTVNIMAAVLATQGVPMLCICTAASG